MGWFIVILILVITLSILYGIIRILTRIFKKSRLLFLITLLLIIVSSYLLSKWYEEKSKIDELNFYLNHVPQELGVSKIIYQNHLETDGMGLPGDNETGIVVFELPESSAKTIQNTGKDFFYLISKEDTPRNKYIRDCGVWNETPIKLEPNTDWHLSTYLDQYGFGIYVEQSVEDDVNDAMSKSGSYFTYCRGDIVLIVAPKIKKVFYFYAG